MDKKIASVLKKRELLLKAESQLEKAIAKALPIGKKVFCVKGKGLVFVEIKRFAFHGDNTRAFVHNHSTGKEYDVYVFPHLIKT